MMRAKQYPPVSLRDEKGMVLVTGLLLIVVLSLLGTTAVMTSTTDLGISGNYKTGNQAFYAAEAGIEEARARLRQNADPAVIPITDTQPANPNWAAYIGAVAKAQGKGYDPTKHGIYTSLQSVLDYTVKIEHQKNAAGAILYWGDSNSDGVNERNTVRGENIYLVTAYGAAAGASKTIAVEMTNFPVIEVKAALYVEAPTTIQGNSTDVLGQDHCGTNHLPAVITTQDTTTVIEKGGPTITTDPSIAPAIQQTANNWDVGALINEWKNYADYKYDVNSATWTGMNWGTPAPGATLEDASSCSVYNVVYFNTNDTYIKLAGGSQGCGILLIDGNLDINGGFFWYGMVIVSGSVTYSGGGDKNITGGVIAGGSVDADLIGGNTNIVWCSAAASNQSVTRSLRRLSWRETF